MTSTVLYPTPRDAGRKPVATFPYAKFEFLVWGWACDLWFTAHGPIPQTRHEGLPPDVQHSTPHAGPSNLRSLPECRRLSSLFAVFGVLCNFTVHGTASQGSLECSRTSTTKMVIRKLIMVSRLRNNVLVTIYIIVGHALVILVVVVMGTLPTRTCFVSFGSVTEV